MERVVPAELLEYLAPYSPGVVNAFLATRERVLTLAPNASEIVTNVSYTVSCGYTFTHSIKQAFTYVSAFKGHVTLGFVEGASLSDAHGLLKGDGAKMRHVRIVDPGDLESAGLRELVAETIERAIRPSTELKPITHITKSKSSRRC
jgi:uncharacterized protein DUF1801